MDMNNILAMSMSPDYIQGTEFLDEREILNNYRFLSFLGDIKKGH